MKMKLFLKLSSIQIIQKFVVEGINVNAEDLVLVFKKEKHCCESNGAGATSDCDDFAVTGEVYHHLACTWNREMIWKFSKI
jgi:hypothetical protein